MQFSRFISGLGVFNKFFYGVILIVLFILSLSIYASYKYSQDIFQREAADNASRLVKSLNEGFQENLNQVDRIIMSIYGDLDTEYSGTTWNKILSTKTYKDLNDEYNSLQVTNAYYQRLLNLREDFNSIYIYVSNEKQISYALNGLLKPRYDPKQSAWFQKTVAAGGSTVISAPHLPFQLDYSENVVSFSRLLKRFDANKDDYYGVILIDLSMDSIQSIVKKTDLSPDTGVVFLDQAGNVVYTNKVLEGFGGFGGEIKDQVLQSPNGKADVWIKNKKYLLTYSMSDLTGWKSLTLTPFSEIQKDRNKLQMFSIFLSVSALLITILIAFIFSRWIFKPILALKEGIVKVKQGNFDFQLQPPSDDELGQLVFSFNTMVLRIKSLITEKYEEVLARQDAEFSYLQSQMNPHFMFNTLQIINGMAVVNEVPDISTASNSLARLLRYSIDLKRRTVTIREEVENAICYLEIQKLRFREFLDYDIGFDEEIYDYSIIKLILQPIIENAIVHGIEPKGENGKIQLTGSIQDSVLRIQVIDNGVGMSADEVESLMREISEDGQGELHVVRQDKHNRVGLKNIQNRIRMIYGPQYGIAIESEPDEWTRVMIELPALRIEGVDRHDD